MRAAKPWCVLRQAQDEAIFFVAPTVDGRPDGPHPEPVEGRIAVDPAPLITSHALSAGMTRLEEGRFHSLRILPCLFNLWHDPFLVFGPRSPFPALRRCGATTLPARVPRWA